MEYKINEIEELAKILEQYGLTNLEIVLGESKITLKKEVHLAQSSNVPSPGMVGRGRTSTDFRHITELKALKDELASTKEVLSEVPKNGTDTTDQRKHEILGDSEMQVKTPIAGLFYRQSAPGNPPYVVNGQHVKKGDILCLVEAMKMINEIVAPCDGIIKEFLVENEEFVEFDRPLLVLVKE